MSTIKISGSVGRIWQITPSIRILRQPMGMGTGAIDRLQQAWQCLDDGVVEWRDVEVVSAKPTASAQ